MAADVTTAKAPSTWHRLARRVRVPLGFFFAAFYVWRAKPLWSSLVVGVILAAFGILVRALASGQVKKDRELTMTGPYTYVRNPLYLGSIIIGVGFAIAARDLLVLVVLVVYFAVVYVPVIRGEEVYLRQNFAGYGEYARRVPSLLPRTLWLAGATKGFSRELYFRHREYNSLLGAAAMLALLIAKIIWLRG